MHHYNQDKLSEIYGVPISKSALAFDNIDLERVNASCNLIRDYIDSTSEVEKMMKFAISLGLPRIGFVSKQTLNVNI